MPDRPQVDSIQPPEAKPGDTITILGSGFQQGDTLELWDDAEGALEKRFSKAALKLLSASEWQVRLPKRLRGGRKRLVMVRDGVAYRAEPTLEIVPLISGLVAAEGTEMVLRGYGFTPSSRVKIGDLEIVPSKIGPEHLVVKLPQDVAMADALSPTVHMAEAPSALPGPAPAMDMTPVPLASTDFDVDRDGFTFANGVDYHAASWGVFVQTFGEAEIKRASRLPTFLLLWGYYALYTSFFEGVGPFRASGLCSGLAALCLERFCAGESPNRELELTTQVRQQLTVRMGKILGRQVLTSAYDQCKQGLANVPVTLNKLQTALSGGIQADTAQMLWFLPGGRITERRFMEQLSNAHAVVPYGLLSLGGADAPRWRIPVYDVNLPRRRDIWVEVEQRGNEWSWFHNWDTRFSSDAGMTLATMPLELFVEPAQFPFSGPFGLTRFLFDMLL